MTRNSFFNKAKSKLILILALISVLAFCSFIFVACNENNKDFPEGEYSYEWSDQWEKDYKITNGNFEYGSDSVTDKEFPQTASISGWTVASDNSSISSIVNSGIIDTNATSFDTLLSSLYDDTDFLNYVKLKYKDLAKESDNIDIDKITEKVKEEHPSATEEEIAEFVKKEVISILKNNTTYPFANPSVHSDATGTKVFMLNNYVSTTSYGGIDLGTAQKVTSSKTITLDKGSFAKLTFFVKTVNLSGSNSSEFVGANIRLTNTVNNTTQADYMILGINTQQMPTADLDNGWAKYTIYVKADDFYENTLTVVLGLGNGLGSSTATKYFVEGTAYFDDISFVTITEEEYNTSTATLTVDNVSYEITSDKKINENKTAKVGTDYVFDFAYDLDIVDSFPTSASTYVKAIDNLTVSGDFTVSSTKDASGNPIKGNKFPDSEVVFDKSVLVDGPYDYKAYNISKIVNSSYTVKFTSESTKYESDFTVYPEHYAVVSFYIKADLGLLNTSAINVYVYDDNKTIGKSELRETITPSLNNDGDWIKVSFVVNNNFPEKDPDGDYTNTVRSFHFEVVIGPTDIVNNDYPYQYASGSVLISVPTIAKGEKYNYVRENYKTTADNTFDSYVEFMASRGANEYVKEYDVKEELTANRTANYNYYSLFLNTANNTLALYAGQNTDYSNNEDKDVYALQVSPSDIGAITVNPANIDGFIGVSTDSAYIVPNGTTDINERVAGTEDGIAGLINTKYLDTYTVGDKNEIKTALNYTDKGNIQPLMIYNKTENAYGFIGDSLSITSVYTARIYVTLRVVGDAKAFVYLVDTSKSTKTIMKQEIPGVNSENLMQFEITSDMMDEDGWLTVNFYIATGSEEKSYRVELWNGARDNSVKSSGYVFIKEVTTSGSFTEVSVDNYKQAFYTDGVLKDMAEIQHKKTGADVNDLTKYTYVRPLDETEIKYNADTSKKGDNVSYTEKYVWVKTDASIYAIYNNIEYLAVNPYDNEPTDDTDGGCGCETDPSTFWMSFSTIILAVSLGLAIVALIVKGAINKRRRNADDSKSHYDVKSRYKVHDDLKQKKAKEEKALKVAESKEEPIQEAEKEELPEEVNEEKSDEEIIYGKEIEEFGMEEVSEEKPIESEAEKQETIEEQPEIPEEKSETSEEQPDKKETSEDSDNQ